MYSYSPRPVHVRPELDRMAEYIPGESLESFSARTGIPVEKLIKLNGNESPYGPAPQVIEALGNHLSYNNYPDTESRALKQALSAYTGVDSRHIVISHGSNELINLLYHIFLTVGDNILSCPPTFTLYTFITTFCGAYVLEVPRADDYEIDVEAIIKALTPETKIIVLCSPNNPTGNPVSEEDVLTLLDTGRIVMVDEAYVEFSHNPKGFAHLVPQYRNLIVMRTFSKWAGLAGLRIGYGIFPDWIVSYMRRAQCPFEVNLAGHIAAIETLNHLDYTLDKVQRIVEERERLFSILQSHRYLDPLPSQGNFILTRVDEDEMKIEHVKQAVERSGILLRYFHHPYLSNYVRLTVGLPEHTDLIHQALLQLEEYK
ncbi:histidinol-phosphate transaminase [Tengunoibacter tsumagoiensis]|uniref:Histidinol-phosphate aminotransferase n=1 Tax=Tengunoibacter tsumagoiensis TaxID=2014871 RepID=A0A401ZW54_9CHLR|nr:histidinol-phosphate transaminase [Tengunoibacter tsumagoiensis]GCE11135.1 histidinol-phosphate aminotransferase [Tengunoibacter tsumagoiensis]